MNNNNVNKNRTLVELVTAFLEKDEAQFSISDATNRFDAAFIKNEIISAMQAMTARGVQAGDRVAVAYPKGIYAIISTYSILALGACYVPVDPRQSRSRAEFIINDCDCALILCDESISEELSNVSIQSLDLKKAANVANGSSIATIVSLDNANDLAAILYTSGSTGVPKGVKLSHKNIMSFVNWALSEFDISKQDVFSWHAKLNFDLSTFDLFVSLALDASLVIVSEADVGNPLKLSQLIRDTKITVWYSVPSILALLARYKQLDNHNHASLRIILFAGEVFPPKLLSPLLEALPACQFYNLYGPTETNVCTYYPVDKLSFSEDKPLPLGYALPGYHLYVMDENKNRVSSGVLGELYVYGDCVTPGYWGLGQHRNSRNHINHGHATGDLVHEIDGCYYYHGRLDNMIKINGYRVEMGEVENVASLFPGVEETLVIGRQTDNGAELILFCTEKNKKISTIELRAFLSDRLPAYMIPKKILVADNFPLNANGKVDRKLLLSTLENQNKAEASNSYA